MHFKTKTVLACTVYNRLLTIADMLNSHQCVCTHSVVEMQSSVISEKCFISQCLVCIDY